MQRTVRARRAGRAGDRRRSAGLIAVLVLVMLVVGAMYAITLGLSTASASVKLSRDQATAAALKQAKDGLIAWAATRAVDGPGHLPCPDRKRLDAPPTPGPGYQESACVGAAARIGRLPFRTLGLPDLRDASGERLWYALSPAFRDGATIPVNSDTQGTLAVEGRSTASNVIAIIFAPGAAVGGQVRDAAVSNVAGNYLEAPNPYVADAFLAWTGCEAGACALPFSGGSPVTMPHNDQFILVTHEDLFRVVEAVVQRRIEQEVAPRLTNPSGTGTGPGYFEQWGTDVYGDARRGFFPFAAPYSDPLATPDTEPSRTQDQYRGRLPQIAGLLPVSMNTTNWVQWSNIAVAKVNALSTGTIVSAPSPTCGPNCDITYICDGTCSIPDNGLDITFSARLRNAASSLVVPTGITAGGDWVVIPSPFAMSVAPRSFDTASGDLLITLNIKLPPTAPATPTLATVTLPTPQFSPLTNPVVSPTNWFVPNEWHRQTYYSVSDGFRLRSDLGTRVIDPLNPTYATAPPCQPDPAPPACIAVDNGPAKARAVLVLAGRNLAGGTRTYTITNYFEGKNNDVPATNGAPPNQVFERQLRTGNFNDRVVVVAPEPVP